MELADQPLEIFAFREIERNGMIWSLGALADDGCLDASVQRCVRDDLLEQLAAHTP